MLWKLLMYQKWIVNKEKTQSMKCMYWRQWDIHTSLHTRSHSWTKDVYALSWIMLTVVTYIQKLQTKRKLVKFATVKIRFWIGLCRWPWPLNTFMIGKFFIVIWKHKTFLWIKMVQLKLVTLELRGYYNIHMIALKQPLVLHIIYHQKFVKKNLIIKNQIFGH